MKVKSDLNLSFFILFFSNSLFYLQAMQSEAPSNLVCQEIPSSSITKPSIKERFKEYSKEKSKKMIEWIKRNKTFVIVFGTITTIATAAMIAKRLREYKGKKELEESIYSVAPAALRHHLSFKYKGFEISEIRANPFEMNSKEINKFLKDRNLDNQPTEIGKSYLEVGPEVFHYNYIKVGNNLYFYPKK